MNNPFEEAAHSSLSSVASFTIPFNLSWHPAATVRAGISERGLPVGLQIVGRHSGDFALLQLAHAFEQATGYGRRRPALAS